MSSRLRNFGFQAYGEVLDLGSGLASLAPALNRHIGGSDDPNFVQSRWRRAHQRYHDIDGWVPIEGDETVTSSRPTTFTLAAVMSVQYQRLRRAQERFGGVHAVAYLLGESAVMLATAAHGRLFEVDPEDPTRVAVGMGIGEDDTAFNVGIINRQYGFMSLTDDHSMSRRQLIAKLQVPHT